MPVVNLEAGRRPGVLLPATGVRVIPVLVVGMALSMFLAISYVICITSYLVLPGLPIKHDMLSVFLPGFELLNWRSFFLGLVESFAWGWYVALIFAPLYNFFALRWR